MEEKTIAATASRAAYTKSELSELLHLFMDIGEGIHRSGGEIDRVEDTIQRLAMAYGAIRADVFAITSSIEVTIFFPDDIELTRTRRIRGSGANNLARLEAYNALSRRCCSAPMTASELRAEIAACETPGRMLPIYLGSALAGGSFAIFFGGRLIDGLIAALFGLFICFLQDRLPRLCPNAATVNFLAALLTGLGVCLLSRLFDPLLPDKIMIGDIMLLIPGIALTISIRNILVGDTISGTLRLVESVIFAAALASGFMLAMGLLEVRASTGDVAVRSEDMTKLLQLLTGTLGSVGFALIFRLPYRYLPLAALGGLLNWGSYLAFFALSQKLFFSCLLASALSALYAELLAKRLRAPTILFLIPTVIPSIPGSNLYYTLEAAVSADFASVDKNALLTCQWAFGIAAGVSLVSILFVMIRNNRNTKKQAALSRGPQK